jgi:hypothetical protein
MNRKDPIKASILQRNADLVESLKVLREKTTHSNISMILDYFIENLNDLYIRFEKGERKEFPKEYDDVKINEYMKMPVADPDSLQSVILYTAENLAKEFKTLNLSETMEPLVKNYINSMDSLRKRAEHMYMDLVERYQ